MFLKREAKVALAAPSETQIAVDVERTLRALVPDAWSLTLTAGGPRGAARRRDAVLRVAPPRGVPVIFNGPITRDPTVRDLARGDTVHLGAEPGALPLLVAGWLGPRVRERLAAEGISFADATGNVRIVSEDPALLITGSGAPKNPWSPGTTLQSLKGRGAARAMRAILGVTPPFGVRELSARTGSPAPTLSRVIGLLEREGLVERDSRGRVVTADLGGCIRRWAQDYDVLRSNDALSYLQPRGLTSLTAALARTDLRYALSGSIAANRIAPFAPPWIGMLYVTDERRAVELLGLRETDGGANVLLLRPFDDVVFADTIERDSLRLVSPPQLAVDLLTSPGRAPAEGEEILAWMLATPDAWRS